MATCMKVPFCSYSIGPFAKPLFVSLPSLFVGLLGVADYVHEISDLGMRKFQQDRKHIGIFEHAQGWVTRPKIVAAVLWILVMLTVFQTRWTDVTFVSTAELETGQHIEQAQCSLNMAVSILYQL